jgi:ribosome biogenesis protein Tsr3
MGLNNLTIATVSDVNFESRFFIHLFDPNSNSAEKGSFFREFKETLDLFYDKSSNFIDIDTDSAGLKNYVIHNSTVENVNDEVKKILFRRSCDDLIGGYGRPAITFTICKYGAITSLSHIWMKQCESNELLTFDKILSCPEACEALSKGFLVKKFQRKQLNREENVEEYEEFELEVCAGSVLLFPSDNAVSVSELDAVDFEVKNLIVLDGTWAKAKRIYSENPWLNILPHLKLEVNEMSLYGEVRNQPKAGYLSTIESIVFALKAVGEKHSGLDNLLDTFESMVGDQRRCKDERLSKLLPS